MSDENNMSEEDFLRKHLSDVESNNGNLINSDIPVGGSNNTNDNGFDNTTAKVSDSEYFNYPVKDLPCGKHYPEGTLIMVRPAKTIEIQDYSMVDDNNFYDIVEKMNHMLQSCVRVKYPGGKMGTFLDIKDQDRLFIIFLIRELTFQNGKSLSVSKTCSCSAKNSIEINSKSFTFHPIEEKIENHFDVSTRTYKFEIVNGMTYELSPPNIGIQKCFTDFIIKENSEERKPNVSFLKIIPFMLPGRNSITEEGIKSKLEEFQKIDDISFQFLNDVVSKMTFGIKELKKNCNACGMEIRTKMSFPNGASGIFVVHDAFDLYIKK